MCYSGHSIVWLVIWPLQTGYGVQRPYKVQDKVSQLSDILTPLPDSHQSALPASQTHLIADMPVAVVTGSNKGIGLAIVRSLCQKFQGDVYLTSRDEVRGQDAVETLRQSQYVSQRKI